MSLRNAVLKKISTGGFRVEFIGPPGVTDVDVTAYNPDGSVAGTSLVSVSSLKKMTGGEEMYGFDVVESDVKGTRKRNPFAIALPTVPPAVPAPIMVTRATRWTAWLEKIQSLSRFSPQRWLHGGGWLSKIGWTGAVIMFLGLLVVATVLLMQNHNKATTALDEVRQDIHSLSESFVKSFALSMKNATNHEGRINQLALESTNHDIAIRHLGKKMDVLAINMAKMVDTMANLGTAALTNLIAMPAVVPSTPAPLLPSPSRTGGWPYGKIPNQTVSFTTENGVNAYCIAAGTDVCINAPTTELWVSQWASHIPEQGACNVGTIADPEWVDWQEVPSGRIVRQYWFKTSEHQPIEVRLKATPKKVYAAR